MLGIALYFATKIPLKALGAVLTLAQTLGKPSVTFKSQIEGIGHRAWGMGHGA
jgi:hypothetical protein